MDKIKELLEKLGSPELANQIVESFENYYQQIQEEKEAEINAKMQKAKQICVEEVENYKRELARKAQLFFESKTEKIENQIAKQAAIRESAAESKLKNVKSLLEGIDVEANSNAQEDIKALKAKLAETISTVKALNESKKAAEFKANRAHQIAEKTLRRNRDLERTLSEAKVQPTKAKDKKVVNEDVKAKKPKKKVQKESKATTSNVINETTMTKAKEQKPTTSNVWAPNSIANTME